MKTLIFEEADHSYWLEDEHGKRVRLKPSVTEALSTGQVFPPGSAERGKHVHTICQFYDENDLDMASVDDAYKGYLESYKQLLEQFKPKWKKIEWTICHPTLLYPGTIDRYGEMLGGTFCLDIKSGSKGSAHLQTAAYAMAVDTDAYRTIRRAAWCLKRDGRMGTHMEFSDPGDYINWVSKLSEWRRNNAACE